MNILIAGCGKIGTAMLADLVSEGHDVTALDSDPAVLSNLSNIYDVMAVCGNIGNCETLGEAVAARTDLFTAATGSDEANLLGCFCKSPEALSSSFPVSLGSSMVEK